MYLLGTFRLPHDVAVESIGVVRFMTAMSFLGLASYLGVGLFAAEKPQGKVWQYIQAFAAPQFHLGEDPTGPYSEHGGLKYALDFERALEFAIKEKKPLFLDFTGMNCTNCRYMEKGTMSRPEIEDRLKRFVRVQLFVDRVPLTDTKEAARLKEINLALQENWFGNVTLPSYVVIPPDREAIKDIQNGILSFFEGTGEEAVFGKFLDDGWNRWQGLANGKGRVVGKR
jgi:thiol:disulfide interchange protein DsbD